MSNIETELATIDAQPDYIEESFGESGHLAVKPGYRPREGQMAMADIVDQVYREGGACIVEAPTGCHAKGQLIMMYDGRLKKVEDIGVGDLLMGPDGKSRMVASLCRGRQEMIDIIPTKGSRWRVNLDHILTLQRTDRPEEIVDISVREWEKWSKNKKHLFKLFRVPIDTFGTYGEESRSPQRKLSPYFLGVLLGDGGMSHQDACISVTCPDEEVLKECRDEAKRLDLRFQPNNYDGGTSCPSFRLVGKLGNKTNPLKRHLKDIGLFPGGAADKFVPEPYKLAPRDVRLEVLAGLIDTDGHLTNGCFEFVSKSKQLTDDTAFIARSVGLAAYPKACRKRWQNGVGTYYRLHISGDTHIIPTKVPHKRASKRAQIKSVLRTGFIIEHQPEEDYYGFSLTGDGRFLLGDFTVTHNTGKSFGYLVPAIWHAFWQDKTTLVCTSNKRLQHQLIDHDLPALANMLPWDFDYCLAKGRTNYACNERMFSDGSVRSEVWRYQDWLQNSRSGDFQDLNVEAAEIVRARKSLALVRSEDCLGRKCNFIPAGISSDPKERERLERIYDLARGGADKTWFDGFPTTCFHHLMRMRMARSEIIITNYHLLFYHYIVMAKTGGMAGLLPPFDAIICDEAHNIADIARDVMGEQMTALGTERAFRKEVQNDIHPHIAGLFDALEVKRMELTDNSRFDTAWLRDSFADNKHAIALMDATRSELNILVPDQAWRDDGSVNLEQISDYKRRSEIQGLVSLQSRMRTLLTDRFDDRQARFIEAPPMRPGKKGQPRCKLGSKQVDVSGFLRSVWDEHTVVFTSATLSVDGRFSHLVSELGLRGHDKLTVSDVPSPFEYKHNSLMYIDTTLPDPSRQRQAWVEAIPSRVIELLCMNGGRAMCLFTSRRMMEAVGSALRTLSDLPFRWHMQGKDSTSAARTFKAFIEDETSVLLGVNTFREGADAPGNTCTMVIMDKIPFPPVNDPVMQALSQSDRNFFSNQMVPRAAIAQKQGIGRLIRSVTDYGVVAILDPRLRTKPYGRALAGSRPRGMPITVDIEDVRKAIERRR